MSEHRRGHVVWNRATQRYESQAQHDADIQARFYGAYREDDLDDVFRCPHGNYFGECVECRKEKENAGK